VEARTAELCAAEAKYRSIFENAAEGIFQIGADGRFLAANPAMAKILGYANVDDLLAEDVNALRFYVNATQRREYLNALKQDGAVRGYRSQLRRRDGSIIWIAEYTRMATDGEGRVLCYEGLVEDITDRKRVEEQLLHDALHDSLTGLPNRALFLDRLTQALALAGVRSRDKYQFAVLYFDCDRFKVINDSLGHGAGDALLMELGQRLSTCLRPGDTLARLGGDEFVLLVDNIQAPEDALSIAAHIQATLRAPFQVETNNLVIAASIGITMGPGEYLESGEILRDADTAMYRAKAAGGGGTILFEHGMHTQALARLHIESDLRLALERDELLVHFQPIIALENGRLAGFEALVRWRHPERGMIRPDE
ncbi:MAG: diguanylate cyclase, partial [Rhodospirillales bacterium]|nr:diguanylate cyclase [Rhodospirillales bacterium]